MPDTCAVRAPLIGIFVGGSSSRMGARPKGLLQAPGGKNLLQATLETCQAGSAHSPIVLVGKLDAYRHFALTALADCPVGIGPLGGLCSLLLEAQARGRGALAIACDFPLLDASLVSLVATFAPSAAAVAPRDEHGWQPLCARYTPARVLPVVMANIAAQRRSLQSVLAELGDQACALSMSQVQALALRDCDTPEAARDLGLLVDD